MNRFFTKTLLLLFAFFTCAVTVSATNYYVDANNGNDGYSGTSVAQAYKTLQKIDSKALLPGDHVYFLNGTYTRSGQKLMLISESGTATNPIVIENYPGHSPVLKFDSWTGIEFVNGSSYVTLRGLKVQGARTSITLSQALNQPGGCVNGGGSQGLYNGTGILAVGPNLSWSDPSTTGNEVPSHIIIENCEVYDCTSSGIAFQQADYVTIRNNQVYNNCWYTIYGTSGINLYQLLNIDGTTGFHNEISGNHVWGNQLKVPQLPTCDFLDGNGIILDDLKQTQTSNYRNPSITYPEYSAKTLIHNNIVTDNGGSGLHFFLSTNFYAYNNTVVNNAFQNGGNNGNAALRIGESSGWDVRNNVFVGGKIHFIAGTNTNYLYSNNYESGTEIDNDFGGASCPTCVSGGMTFVNQDNSQSSPYKTASSSSVIDQGVNLANFTTDYLGVTRNLGSSYDLGAYEVPYVCTSSFTLPNQIQAENYDFMSGVQTESTADTGGGLNVSYIDAGDELNYFINAPSTGYYPVELRVAAIGTGNKTIEIWSNGVTVQTVDFTATNGWQNWITAQTTVLLTAGCQKLTIHAVSGDFNINWIDFGTPVSTLPVELLGFSATVIGHSVELSWATATETNNDYFSIERSADAIFWNDIAHVSGAGNANQTQTYTKVDFEPLTGVSYYRLAQKDIDGAVNYSEVQAVKIESGSFGGLVAAYPNPTTGQITLVGENMSMVQVFDMLGKEVTGVVAQSEVDPLHRLLDLGALDNGLYVIRSMNSSVLVQKR